MADTAAGSRRPAGMRRQLCCASRRKPSAHVATASAWVRCVSCWVQS